MADHLKRFEAILSLRPNASFVLDGVEVNWHDEKQTEPTNSEIDAEVIRLKAEWIAQEYSRNRKAEYPDWGSQLNKIYDDGLTKWKSEMVDPVKAKWPKDNSGPV